MKCLECLIFCCLSFFSPFWIALQLLVVAVLFLDKQQDYSDGYVEEDNFGVGVGGDVRGCIVDGLEEICGIFFVDERRKTYAEFVFTIGHNIEPWVV